LFNRTNDSVKPLVRVGKKKISLSTLGAGKIGTWRIDKASRGEIISASE
jgi:hypothetical protein